MSHSNRITWSLPFILALGGVVLCLSSTVSAQVNTGSISGIVRDASGAAIPGAAVAVTNMATGAERDVRSGDIGQYSIVGLHPGKYTVKVSSPNFKASEVSAEVTVGTNLNLNLQLEVGTTSTVVEVVAAGGTQVNTQTQELSQLVDSNQLVQLPSLTRNPYDFVALSGNVSSGDNTTGSAATASANSGQTLTNRGVGYSINGQRQTGTEILLDGIENISIFSVNIGQPVPTDAIQEFSIITNNFGAEYGRASGGIVSVDTKPAGNDYHGSVFEYNRLSAYTANTFANDVNDLPKGTYTRNQFGFNFGGPIIKNKLFATFSEEFVRVRSSSSQTEEVLDPAFINLLPANIQSYFSQYGTGAVAGSGKVTTAGQLAGTSAAPNGFPLINGVTPVPASTPVFDTVNFTAPFNAGGGVPQNTYNLLGRLDFNASNTTQMFFRFARYSEDDFNGSVFYGAYPQYNVGATYFDNSGLFSITHAFTPNVLSNSKVSFTRFNSENSFNTSLTNTPNLYLAAGSPSDPVTGTLIQMPGLENINIASGGNPVGGPQNTLQLVQDLTWTKGRHTMRFGGEFTYIQLNYAYGAYAQAVEQLGSTLSGGLNGLVNAGGVTDPSSGAFASPLIAFTARVNPNGVLPCRVDVYGNLIQTPSCTVIPPLQSASYARSYRYKDWAIYAGDSFRITRRLTLNYALRYEHYGVQHNNNQNLDSNFYAGPGGGAFTQSIRDGQVEIVPQSSIGQFWAPKWGTPAPRVGFAYDVFGNGKTALRGGFGISYERNFGNVTYNASFNPPASAVLSDICNPNSSAVVVNCAYLVTNNNQGPLGQPGPPSPVPPVELRYIDNHINVAQTQFWSMAVEHQLAPNTIVAVSYSGAHGVHLYDLTNYNNIGAAQAYLGDPLLTGSNASGTETCPFTNPSTGIATCYTRPNSQYAAINDRGSNGVSTYNALNVKFQTQNIHHTGLSIIANYTFAHTLDDLSATFSDTLGQTYVGSTGYTDPTHPQLDYGSSDYDIRHRFVVSPIWTTPWFASSKGWRAQALGGWNVSGIYTVRTGIPFSVYDFTDDLTFYNVPRLTPATPIVEYQTGTPVNVAPNLYSALSIPPPANIEPLNPKLGISDYGPFPANMTGRNAFRGPGAWNVDAAVQKDFRLTERFSLVFRAEGFDLVNHHNYYVNPTTLAYNGATTTPMQVTELKGGLGTLALGGNNDERRFGQFSLRLTF